ncbi:hypothetical protein [Streptomyces sp. NRRL S-146]|uniref:hypothetical protein n=1 Tax=Streptomyces sp. NRRL S-146 TaxID=1463884 RepID=UPI0004C63A45|nr:hypothetical protein [Streptomyces sp. NRRL S-146]
MTEPIARAIPSPAVLARAPRPPQPQPRPVPVPVPQLRPQPVQEPYDRDRWEDAVFSSELHANARLVALALAHRAGVSGYLPIDGPQNAHRLAERTNLSPKQVRISMHLLEEAGFISRPDYDTWQPKELVRPVTLVRPAPPVTRSEPAHPSEAEG